MCALAYRPPGARLADAGRQPQLFSLLASDRFDNFTEIQVVALENGVPTIVAAKSVRCRLRLHVATPRALNNSCGFVGWQNKGVGQPLSGNRLATYNELASQALPQDQLGFIDRNFVRITERARFAACPRLARALQIEDESVLVSAIRLGRRAPARPKFVIFSTQVRCAWLACDTHVGCSLSQTIAEFEVDQYRQARAAASPSRWPDTRPWWRYAARVRRSKTNACLPWW
jgi:hypothetical protein